MRREATSHRESKSRFVRIDLDKRDTGSQAIVTCKKHEMEAKIKEYQGRGYQLMNVTEI